MWNYVASNLPLDSFFIKSSIRINEKGHTRRISTGIKKIDVEKPVQPLMK